MIDPGGEVPRILAEIQRLGVAVERIALTHGHIDHAAGAAELKEALGGIPIEGPDERDRFLLDGLAEQGRSLGLPDARPVTPDRWLHEGDTLDLAGAVSTSCTAPATRRVSVVFVNQAARFAFVGDVLFRGSVGRTDFPYGNRST